MSDLERDLYLAARTVGDVDAARRGPAVLGRRVARRAARRRLYQAGAPVVPSLRRPRPAKPAASMSVVDAVAVLLGLLVLGVGGVACAVTGNWPALLLVLPAGLGLLLWAGRGGRDGLKR